MDDDTAAALRAGFPREQRERDTAGLRDLLAREEITVDDRSLGHLVDLLLGPLHHRVLVSGSPIDEELVDTTARLTLTRARAVGRGPLTSIAATRRTASSNGRPGHDRPQQASVRSC
ncbi:TetR-like C-terminal domain-containing protein [Streptomyces sp. NPDC052701]|uniref:TetR-like C-terminal domain-containing protein n=1 Tax=Streptomyces sp. NPDC052701 TaxID=3155533 RepID=UPI0034232800